MALMAGPQVPRLELVVRASDSTRVLALGLVGVLGLGMPPPVSWRWGDQGTRNVHLSFSRVDCKLGAPKHCDHPQDFRGS